MAIELHSSPRKRPVVEVEIDGKRVPYNGCSQDSLEDAKAFYSKMGWEYIGSSHVYYTDGVRNETKDLHHFFY